MSGHPMRPIEFLVLAVLNDGDAHGYGIVQEIGRRTGGRVEVKPGNLYRVLDRLMDRGLLESAARRPAGELGNERRRYYGITERGRVAVTDEARLLGEIVDGVRGAAAGATESAR